jgi:hypothetical protein
MSATKPKPAKAAFQGPGPTISIPSAVDPGAGLVTLNVFDGTRQLIKPETQILLTVHDGQQNQLYRDFVPGPTIPLKLPIHQNLADDYSIIAWADGSEQAGFQPVIPDAHSAQTLDIMLLAKKGTYHFAQAKWTDLQSKKQPVAKIFSASVAGDASDAYGELIEDHPDHLACLLNMTTAMEQIFLPSGGPLDYLKTFDLSALAPDRIFGFADAKLVDQVRAAASQGEFQVQPAADLTLHGDATSSFKQIQFGEANVQLTFHEKNRKTIDGVDCVYVEPDIDYFKDPGAHLLLEVIPNALTGHVTNPRVVYVLRWIVGQRAGLPNFDPLYTIE